MLYYDYITNYYRLIPFYLSKQGELDAGPKAIQQIAFVGLLKKLNANDNDESMLILTTEMKQN